MATTYLQSTIRQIHSRENIAEISRAMGVDEATARKAVDAALPALIAGMGKNASTPEGARALNVALETHRGGAAIVDIDGYVRSGGQVDEGQRIVGHVLGDRAGEIEDGLGRGLGISGKQVGTLLAALAPLVLGALSKDQEESNAGAGGLAGMLLGPNSPILDMLGASDDSPAAAVAGMLGGLLGSGTGSSNGPDTGSLLGSLLGGGAGSSGGGSAGGGGAGGDAMAGMLGSLLGGALGGGSGSSGGDDPLAGMLGSLLGGGGQGAGAAGSGQPDIGALLGGLLGAGSASAGSASAGSASAGSVKPSAPAAPQGGTDLNSLMGDLLGGKS